MPREMYVCVEVCVKCMDTGRTGRLVMHGGWKVSHKEKGSVILYPHIQRIHVLTESVVPEVVSGWLGAGSQSD